MGSMDWIKRQIQQHPWLSTAQIILGGLLYLFQSELQEYVKQFALVAGFFEWISKTYTSAIEWLTSPAPLTHGGALIALLLLTTLTVACAIFIRKWVTVRQILEQVPEQTPEQEINPPALLLTTQQQRLLFATVLDCNTSSQPYTHIDRLQMLLGWAWHEVQLTATAVSQLELIKLYSSGQINPLTPGLAYIERADVRLEYDRYLITPQNELPPLRS